MKRTVLFSTVMSIFCLQPALGAGYDTYDIPTNITADISMKMDEFKALQLLIHVNWIASRISREETVLEDEYNQINHEGLNLTYLKDEDARACLMGLSDAITNARKKSGDVKMAERVKDAQLRKAFFESAPDPVAILKSDWRTMAFVAVQAGFSWFMNYQTLKAEIKLQYDQEMWRIEKEDMVNINTFYKDMLDHQARLVSQYKLDDTYRVTSEEFKNLFKWIDEFDDQSAYRMLCHSQDAYAFSTFYWYHRGVLAYKLKKSEEALKCFRTFQKVHVPFIRKDKMAALVAQGIIELMGKESSSPDKEEIKRQLDIIKRNAREEDWELHRFAAIIDYGLLKQYSAAEKHICKAIGHLTLSYAEELRSYLARLCEEKKLEFVKWRKFRNENVPPSAENLMQCRALLFQILTASKSESANEYAANFWSRYDVSNIERLMYSSFLQETNFVAGLCSVCGLANGSKIVTNCVEKVSSGKLSNESGNNIVSDVFGIDVDYDFNDYFWVYIPLRWVYTMPTNITFSIYGNAGAEIFRGNENVKYREVIIRDKKPVFAIEIDTRGAKKAFKKSEVTGFSLNFEHQSFRSRLYVKKYGDTPTIQEAIKYQEDFERFLWAHPGYVVKKPKGVMLIATALGAYEAAAMMGALYYFCGTPSAEEPIILDYKKASVVSFGKKGSLSALDFAHANCFNAIGNPQSADIGSDRLHGFLLMYENKSNGTCTVIDFSELLASRKPFISIY